MKITKRQLRKIVKEAMSLPVIKAINRNSRKQLREMADLDQYTTDMTSEQLLTITKLLKQVDPVSMRDNKIHNSLILDLGAGKEIDVWPNGAQHWLLNGKRHRTDGPAVIYVSGTQHWYQNDKLHREDGPAVIRANGVQYWALNGKELSKAEHAKAVGKSNKFRQRQAQGL